MNAGILPIALIFLAIALSLSFASRRGAMVGIGITAIVSAILGSLAIGQYAIPWIFFGLWVSAIATIGLMHIGKTISLPLAAAAGLNAGAWAGALAAASALRPQAILAVPILFLALPGYWLVQRGNGIAVKVVGSWIVAVAILAIFVSLTPTPGYKPDHMQ